MVKCEITRSVKQNFASSSELRSRKKTSVYAGLRHFERSFDNKLITVISERLFLQSTSLWVRE